MSSVTPKQKEKALELYGDVIEPLAQDKLEWCVKQSAKHIYVDHKGNGWCSRCESKVMLPKTKHLEEIKCPNCNHKMKALHVWRRKSNKYCGLEDSIDWFTFPEVINDHTLMFRYVVVYRADTEPEYGERARLIIDFLNEKEYTLERNQWHKTWEYSTRDYFRETGMGYSYRRWCCLPAKIYPYTYKRVGQINKLSNIVFTMELFDKCYPSAVAIHSWKHADLYEKLSKVGMQGLMIADLRSYKGLKYDDMETSLIKMLGLNKNTFNILKTCQTLDALEYLKAHPNTTRKDFDDAALLGFSDSLVKIVNAYGIKYGKTFQYIKRNAKKNASDFVIDYRDYLYAIDQLGYPMDNQYLYPKDFRKADARVQKEFREREDRRRNMTPLEKIKEEARIDEVINKISVALRENEELKRWMVGSNGLKVIVPQSVGELTDEGIKLHNCLKTYARKIADKQSLIFFIRKLNDPNKEFIAMEYENGKITQIRLDNNIAVKQADILQFADQFARKLNQLDIMNKIRRVA